MGKWFIDRDLLITNNKEQQDKMESMKWPFKYKPCMLIPMRLRTFYVKVDKISNYTLILLEGASDVSAYKKVHILIGLVIRQAK